MSDDWAKKFKWFFFVLLVPSILRGLLILLSSSSSFLLLFTRISKLKQHWASSVLGWVTIWLGCSNPSIDTSFIFFSIQTFFKFSKIFNFDQNLKNLQFLPNFQISSTPKFEKSSNFYEMFKFLQFCPKFE